MPETLGKTLLLLNPRPSCVFHINTIPYWLESRHTNSGCSGSGSCGGGINSGISGGISGGGGCIA
jgi:hypothetical protein